ncbi:hypothetical protein [Novosphingobium sp.]|uniref:hypothetical protein n=1 Tax=Novosphingobium sp. TaxID=1874826 RepID=UPI002FDA1440
MTDATQPGLRSFIVYDELPAGCIAFEVPDSTSLPHVRPGEFVVIDPEDRDPAEGELFAITWKSSFDRKWQIVQMDLRAGRYGKNGVMRDESLWFVGAPAPQRMMSLAGHYVGEAIRWADGPYYDDYLRDITHGKIIGILEPDFRAALKKAA